MVNNFFASKLQNENQGSDKKKSLILILKNVFLKYIFQVLFISVWVDWK